MTGLIPFETAGRKLDEVSMDGGRETSSRKPDEHGAACEREQTPKTDENARTRRYGVPVYEVSGILYRSDRQPPSLGRSTSPSPSTESLEPHFVLGILKGLLGDPFFDGN